MGGLGGVSGRAGRRCWREFFGAIAREEVGVEDLDGVVRWCAVLEEVNCSGADDKLGRCKVFGRAYVIPLCDC
jgi:hypothetical protein